MSTDGVPLVERTGALFDALGVPWVLVGVRPEYASLGRLALADAAEGVGPLGGLLALLRHAGDRAAVAVACDMPFLSQRLLARLRDAPAGPPVVAARRDGRWEPLFARFEARTVLPVAQRRCERGELSLQGLLDELDATPLPTTPEEERELDDWDEPADILARTHEGPR